MKGPKIAAWLIGLLTAIIAALVVVGRKEPAIRQRRVVDVARHHSGNWGR
jgi:hypothetical protein